MKWMVNGIVVDDAELRRLNLPIAGDCITKQCGNDKTKGDGKFLPPPTYKGLYEEAVQRLNKVWEESHKSNVKHLEIMTKLLKDMEEKKTKKMTKAEAFEYLKGKKVLCYSSKMEVVQGFVKSLGFHWSDYSEEPMLVSILFLGEDGRLTYSVSLKRFEEHEYEEISADDILSIEIVEEKKVLSVDCALEHAKWIMKYLREECSPHTKMIIEGDHAELVEGVKSVVWKE